MSQRTITVKGVGNVSARPDLIIITMNLTTKDYTYEGAMHLAANTIESIRKSLIDVGYEKENLKTTDFSINTDYESYKDKDGNYRKKFVGYECRHDLKLEFDFDMECLNKTLSAISSSKANPKFEIKFSIKDKNAVSEELLKNAIENATKKASVLATASGLTLGKIQNIDYNWGEIMLYSRTRMQEPIDCCEYNLSHMDIDPEDINVNDTVTVIWEID